MRRTMILSALGTTAMLIGLGVGAAIAAGDPVQSSPVATHAMMADCPMTGMQMMIGSSMMEEQVPAIATDHAAHHQENRP